MGKLRQGLEGMERLSLGISIVVAVLLGVGAGILMQRAFGSVWFLWLGVFWGVAAAGLNIYKAYKRLKQELDEVANDPKYRYPQEKWDDEDEDA